MQDNSNPQNSPLDINLKSLIGQIKDNKYFFLVSVVACMAIALVIAKLSTPIYEVSTSILLDPSGNNRSLGESQYVEGGVGLMEMEKNLFNELGIIQSFTISRKTVEDLKFNITYESGNWFKMKEMYGYFPFRIIIDRKKPQVLDVPFSVTIISDSTYQLSIDTQESFNVAGLFSIPFGSGSYYVTNPINNSVREVQDPLTFTRNYRFGEMVDNQYFTFVLDHPGYDVNLGEFKDKTLQFTIHDYDDLANEYLDKLEVENIDINASIFRISSTGPVPRQGNRFFGTAYSELH